MKIVPKTRSTWTHRGLAIGRELGGAGGGGGGGGLERLGRCQSTVSTRSGDGHSTGSQHGRIGTAAAHTVTVPHLAAAFGLLLVGQPALVRLLLELLGLAPRVPG